MSIAEHERHVHQVAQQAFSQVKQKFASAPILVQLDFSQPFVLEVDALCYPRTPGVSFTHVHISLVISHRLSRNCDVGHWELLAIKLTLEE